MPSRGAEWRDHFGAWFIVGVVACLVYAMAAPALAPFGAAIVRAQAVRGGLESGASALWLMLGRIAIGFPLGDPLAHLRALSGVASAGAVSLWLWRSAHDGRVAAAGALSAVELVGATAGVLTLALSRSFFHAATTVGPLAVDMLLTLACLVLAERVWRSPSDRRAGLALAVAAGALAGASLAAAAIAWPPTALVWARALRRRERWPVPASIVFGVAAIVSVVELARGSTGIGAPDLASHLFLVPVVHALSRVSTAAAARAAAELADQVGILAVLVAGAGLLRLRATARIFTLWPLLAGLVLRAAFGGGVEGTIGIVVAVAALALPLGVGTVRLAERLGRAAVPAAAAIGVIVAVWPLLAR